MKFLLFFVSFNPSCLYYFPTQLSSSPALSLLLFLYTHPPFFCFHTHLSPPSSPGLLCAGVCIGIISSSTMMDGTERLGPVGVGLCFSTPSLPTPHTHTYGHTHTHTQARMYRTDAVCVRVCVSLCSCAKMYLQLMHVWNK